MRFGGPRMNAPLRIGIAGIGRMGQRHALHLAHRTLGAQLVAACSPVASELEWARDKLNVKHLYRDYRDPVAHPGLEAVFLVTPTRSAGLSWYARRPRTR